MSFLCKIGLHKWRKIYRSTTYYFMDEPCKGREELFRKCERCSKVQHRTWNGQCWYWETLGDCERKIVFKYLKKGDLTF